MELLNRSATNASNACFNTNILRFEVILIQGMIDPLSLVSQHAQRMMQPQSPTSIPEDCLLERRVMCNGEIFNQPNFNDYLFSNVLYEGCEL